MIGKCCSFFGAGCLILVALSIAMTIYIYSSAKSGKGLKAFIGGVNRPPIIIQEKDEDNLYEKVESFSKTLESQGKAELILSEEEATVYFNSYIDNSDDSRLYIYKNLQVDFEPELGVIYADGPFGSEFKINTEVIEDGTSIVPSVVSVRVGKLKAPNFIADKASTIIAQSLEQLKTNNLGSQKITRLRFMKDNIVLEISKI